MIRVWVYQAIFMPNHSNLISSLIIKSNYSFPTEIFAKACVINISKCNQSHRLG